MYQVTKKHHHLFSKLFKLKKEANAHERKLLKKSYKYLHLIQWIPGLQMIGICNSLSMLATHKDSDIDLFVITKKNRLWTVRILLTLFFFIVWQRKTWENHAKKFCLSFFIDETAINLENIAIEDDIYLFHWILYLKPIINYNHSYENFIEANSKWCNLKDFKKIIEGNKKYIQTQKNTWNFWHLIWDIFETIIKKIFIRKTLNHYKKLWKPFWVIINNHMLKFHNNDKRIEISETIE